MGYAVGPEKHTRRQRRRTNLERSIEGMARRRATKQLLRVPWDRFRKAYAAYPRWLAFTLWAQAILEVAGRPPSSLLADLKTRCPSFVASEASKVESELVAYRLHEWVHNQIFRGAKEEGWLDALIFFGVRDIRSRAAWAYSEHCAKEWGRRRPRSYPSFERWWQVAQKYRFCKEAGAVQIGTALKRYIELQAVAYWVEPLLGARRKMPAGIMAELERICPGLPEFSRLSAHSRRELIGRAWKRFMTSCEDRFFVSAKRHGWLEIVAQQARNDPRYVRMRKFWKRSCQSGPRGPRSVHPSFDRWQRDLDNYVER